MAVLYKDFCIFILILVLGGSFPLTGFISTGSAWAELGVYTHTVVSPRRLNRSDLDLLMARGGVFGVAFRLDLGEGKCVVNEQRVGRAPGRNESP